MGQKTGWQLPHDVLEHYRFRAIELWKEGEKVNSIAHYFGLHRVTVSYWISKYREGGKTALKSKKAPGPDFKLSKNEIERVLKDVRKDATEFGFATPLWTTKRLGAVIQKKTKKKLHDSNVWRMLKRLGFSSQKPERRAKEFDPEEWNKWMRTIWPEILENARKWQAIVYFHDECSVSLIPMIGKTWAPKGKRPKVNVTGNRGSISVSSAISRGGRLLFRTEEGTIDNEAFMDFLKQLLLHHKHRKVIVITDRARPHTAGPVREFAEKNKKRFSLYLLPSYSSHKNPDENTWGYLKDKKLKTHQAQSKKELRPLVTSGMKSIQMRPHIVRTFFHNSFVK